MELKRDSIFLKNHPCKLKSHKLKIIGKGGVYKNKYDLNNPYICIIINTANISHWSEQDGSFFPLKNIKSDCNISF